MGSFGFRRSGRRGWRVERREEIVWVEGGFDSACERALGCERFVENREIGIFELRRGGD